MSTNCFQDSFPDGTDIRCINFGSPPVFKSNTAENAESDNCDNIFREARLKSGKTHLDQMNRTTYVE